MPTRCRSRNLTATHLGRPRCAGQARHRMSSLKRCHDVRRPPARCQPDRMGRRPGGDDPAGRDRRHRHARTGHRPQADADGAGRARLPLRGARRGAVAVRPVRSAQPTHPLPLLLRRGRRRLARRRVRGLLVLCRRHPGARPPARPRHHVRHGITRTPGQPASLCRTHGLDRRALVHDPYRALLG